MKRYLLILCFSVFCGFFSATFAKTVKFGSHIRYEGEYDKQAGARGYGVITMRTKKANGFEKFMAEASAASQNQTKRYGQRNVPRNQQTKIELSHPIEAVVEDRLEGTFNGNEVTEAKLHLNGGVSFEGTLEYEIDCQEKDVDKIIYQLKSGTITIGREIFQIEDITPENQTLTITRTMNRTHVAVSSSTFYRINPLTKEVKVGQFTIDELMKNCKQYEPTKIIGKASIDSLENVVKVQKKHAIEQWSLRSTSEPLIFKDSRNRVLSTKVNGEEYTINIGDEESITFSNTALLRCLRNFQDAKLSFSPEESEIHYSDGKTYKGTLTVGDRMYSNGVFFGRQYDTKDLLSKLLDEDFSMTRLQPFKGKMVNADGSIENEYFYSHTLASLQSVEFSGSWELRLSDNFEKMQNVRANNTYIINSDGTYTFMQEQRVFNRIVTFDKHRESGTWKLSGNKLVFNENPATSQYTRSIYPGTISSIKFEELEAIRQQEQRNTEQFVDSIRRLPSIMHEFDIYSTLTEGQIWMFKDEQCYGLFRKNIQNDVIEIEKSAIVGRWGIADYDQVIDINSDGTYTRYSTTRQVLNKWTEVFQSSTSGTWTLNNDELILISNSRLTEVNAFAENPAYFVSQSEFNNRNKELHSYAVSSQAEQRASDYTRGTFSRITRLASDFFYAKDNNGQNYQFYRLSNK